MEALQRGEGGCRGMVDAHLAVGDLDGLRETGNESAGVEASEGDVGASDGAVDGGLHAETQHGITPVGCVGLDGDLRQPTGSSLG